LDAAALVNEPEDHPRRTTHDLHTRAAKCTEADLRDCRKIFVNSNKFYIFVVKVKKGKTIPLQAWTGPEGSRRLRLADFKTIGT
jgi:hypothetical protein